ncbi:MAG TPA: hypothetical protein VNO70_04715, partial [Blastocatellia bacterium]|nr:hypothetical protein [Blastocatellia bacterium]
IHVQAATFNTTVVDASVPVTFARALLTTGTANADGSVVTVDLANPLEEVSGFLAQDNDFAPFYFKNPHELGRRIRAGVESGEIENLFLVLQIQTSLPFPGVSGQPSLIGLDGGVAMNDAPIFGLSYFSDDGGTTWTRSNTFNFMFSLVVTEPRN